MRKLSDEPEWAAKKGSYMVSTASVHRIEIPSAKHDTEAYVEALLDLAETRNTFEVLTTTPVRARDMLADFPTELADQEPEPAEWPVALILGHLFDVDIVYGFRWRLVLTEDYPSYPGYDEQLWAPLPRLPLWQTIDAWTGLRAANVAMLRSVPAGDWQRMGCHGEQDAETLEVMIRKVVGHDLAHVNQLYRTARQVL